MAQCLDQRDSEFISRRGIYERTKWLYILAKCIVAIFIHWLRKIGMYSFFLHFRS